MYLLYIFFILYIVSSTLVNCCFKVLNQYNGLDWIVTHWNDGKNEKEPLYANLRDIALQMAKSHYNACSLWRINVIKHNTKINKT